MLGLLLRLARLLKAFLVEPRVHLLEQLDEERDEVIQNFLLSVRSCFFRLSTDFSSNDLELFASHNLVPGVEPGLPIQAQITRCSTSRRRRAGESEAQPTQCPESRLSLEGAFELGKRCAEGVVEFGQTHDVLAQSLNLFGVVRHAFFRVVRHASDRESADQTIHHFTFQGVDFLPPKDPARTFRGFQSFLWDSPKPGQPLARGSRVRRFAEPLDGRDNQLVSLREFMFPSHFSGLQVPKIGSVDRGPED